MNAKGFERNEKNPREHANVFEVIFFTFTFKTFKTGWKTDFGDKNLYKTLTNQRSKHWGNILEMEWSKQLSCAKPSLFNALRNMFAKDVINNSILLGILLAGRLVQSVPLYYLMLYFTPGQTDYTFTDGAIFTTLVIAPSLLYVMLIHWYLLTMQQVGLKMRVACCSLVYRKSLRLSRKALGETTIGQLVNLLSNDVNRFDWACFQMPMIIVAPFELILSVVLLYVYAGSSPMIAVVFILVQIPLQIYLGRIFSKIRLKTALKTDERVRLMNEIIAGIQVIKMYTWENPFIKLIAKIRGLEVKEIRSACNIKAFLLSLSVFSARLAVFLAVIVYILTGNIPSAPYMFMVVSLFNVLRQSLTVSLPNAIVQLAEALISVGRIEKFLLYEERVVDALPPDPNSEFALKLTNVTARWVESLPDNSLEGINLELTKPNLMAVIGAVGSGKTSLIKLILRELPLRSGSLYVNGKISYASDEPWLFAGSIKENILFGETYNQKRYNKVIEVCALKRDLTLFPFGDDTLIGERGSMLSGGQRARVNLARAIYRDADIYLLDDPLSAVDAHVGKQIFDDCIRDYLRDKCTILVTHQIQYLKLLPHILMLQDGKPVYEGDYNGLHKYAPHFATILKEEEEDEPTETQVTVFEERSAEKVTEMMQEFRRKGKVKMKVYEGYIKAGGSWWSCSFVASLLLLSQLFASACDYFITYWVNTEQVRPYTNEEELLSTNACIYIYSALIFLMVAVTMHRSAKFFSYCMTASTNLHNNMFEKIVRAPLTFFHKNTSGRILNRFSKDMGAIDDIFPVVAVDALQIALSVSGILVVTIIVCPLLLVPIVFVLGICIFLRKVYLRTSRSLKRLEGTTKSPVFTHINSSLQGLTTIRALQAEAVLQDEFDNLQDIHSCTYDLFISISRAFAFYLDLTGCIYIAITGYLLLVAGNNDIAGNVGLALTQTLNLTGMLQWGMRQWTETENNMTSVERVFEYTMIESEKAQNERELKAKWPTEGAIEFRNVYMKYAAEDQYVLKDLNFAINAKEKVGVVGRTGAGKSSIIISLFQLSNTSGAILIDGVDTRTIRLDILRSHISIIPQEPVLFEGTLRRNLDPFEEHDDSELWSVLEKVELKYTAKSFPLGLLSKMSEGGSNFSIGQRQLFCLARAILRNNKMLIMDEATANVDPHTDSLIQRTIKREFEDCTILTIAHRLHTILDCDKVLVMDAGESKEFDHPHILLQNKESLFSKMVAQTGRSTSMDIANIVENNYYKTHEKKEGSIADVSNGNDNNNNDNNGNNDNDVNDDNEPEPNKSINM